MTFGKYRNFKVKKRKKREGEIQQQGLTEFCLACGSQHSKTFFSTQIQVYSLIYQYADSIQSFKRRSGLYPSTCFSCLIKADLY